MSLVSRLSLSTYLKNFFGVRGGYGPGVDESIAPVFDVGRPDPVNDDLVFYWTVAIEVAAVAAQFAFACLSPAQGRLILDSMLVGGSSAATRIRLGRGALVIAAPAPFIPRNALTGQLSAVGWSSGNQVADPTAGGSILGHFNVAAPPITSPQYALGYAISRGEQLVISPDVVNVSLRLTLIGRSFPSFPE
jgi:hypothetical protein